MDKIIQPSLSPVGVNFNICKYDRTALDPYSILNGSYGSENFAGSYFVPIYNSSNADPTTTITKFLISFGIFDKNTKIEQWKLDFGDGEKFIGSCSVQSNYENYVDYTTGTVAVSVINGKTVVTGTGTTFDPVMVGGILNVGTGSTYTISAYNSSTSLTIDGSLTYSNGSYTITFKGMTPISSSGSTFVIKNANDFPSSGVILIDKEYMSYTSKTNNTLNGVVRGIAGTTAAFHSANALVKSVTEVAHQYQYDGGNNINASLAASLTAIDTRGRRVVSRKMVYPKKPS